MDRSAIKTFATEARRSLLTQVEARVAQFGITPDRILEPQTVAGGLMVAGVTLDAQESKQYEQLRRRLRELQGQENSLKASVTALIDEVAYTWFNRLAALRFMEVNGYCRRVLSSSDPKLVDPDLLRDASDIAELEDLPGFNRSVWVGWRELAQSAPNPEEFLYRRLLELQCKALAVSLPFLFSETYTALFMPGNLLNQDSIVRKLVGEIPEGDWRDTPDSENGVEIVGWLYQFYISERKDAVIGAKSKVAARDIPAATQLFTPHWIVRYMVENSLGRLWLEGHPESLLREKMPFYLESPTDQDSDESGEKGSSPVLQPQKLTVMDPACGSGHILVYAFDLLFEIYKEQGYLERDIPALILEHNLHGLDIDERAVQLASFAVLMKARAKNQRILRKPPKLNILTVRSTRHISIDQFQVTGQSVKVEPISDYQLSLGSISSISQQLPLMQTVSSPSIRSYPLLDKLLKTFEDADHLGSLIAPSDLDIVKLSSQLDKIEANSPIFVRELANLREIVRQALLLNRKYWIVVANPPYMGGGSFNFKVNEFVKNNYLASKNDLFAVFMERCLEMVMHQGFISNINQHSWMFLGGYENLRKKVLRNTFFINMIHLGIGVFQEINSKVVQSTAFVLKNIINSIETKNRPVFVRLIEKHSPAWKCQTLLNASNRFNEIEQIDFLKLPGSPISYWATKKYFELFSKSESLSKYFFSDGLTKTGNNDRYLKFFWEIDFRNLCENEKYRICAKGGDSKKYYGNMDILVTWTKDSRSHFKSDKVARITPEYLWDKAGITWTKITSIQPTFRFLESKMIAETAGPAIFTKYHSDLIFYTLGFLCSKVSDELINFINPTLSLQTSDVLNLPFILKNQEELTVISKSLVEIYRADWDFSEISIHFQYFYLLSPHCAEKTIKKCWMNWRHFSDEVFSKVKELETTSNRKFIDIYTLNNELTPEVSDDQITIRRADLDRDTRSFFSYAVGCMMGRYSLDQPGLIHAGQPFDPSRHKTFPADADAILPITDQAYFDDDIVTRFVEFVKVAYSPDTLTENLDFIANALELKAGETALQRIRRYFVNEFVSDHIKTYKKRPIYWLFTSGKKRAFGALVYLHRYTPNTVARLRTDYVLELQLKLDKEIEQAQQQIDNATSTAAKKTAAKRLKTLQEQQLELRDYQAKLQTVADQRIDLDLDDGVAYNYTRFKGLVYEGSDLKMTDLEAKAQWKIELLQQQSNP